MDYPAPAPAGATPWRRATLIAAAVAVVELAVIVVAGVAIFGKTVAKHVEKAAVAHVYAPAKTTATPLGAPAGLAHLPRSQTVVTVLNGGAISGAAATKAQAVRSLGYMVGQVAAAYDDARSARSLNPLSVEPLFLQAYTAPGFAAGEALLIKSVRLQPRNPDAWVQLGEYELDARRYRRAYQALNRAYTLDRWNATAVKGRELDQARCRVDPTTCRGSGLPAPRAGRSS